MSEQLMLFMIGDVSNDGHGKYESIPMKVSIQNESFNKFEYEIELEKAENLIKEKYNIDLSLWFAQYEDNTILSEDVQKLIELDVDLVQNDVNEKTGNLVLYSAEDYFDIWKQLIEKANSNIKIEKIDIPMFFGKCTGYGLYQ